MTSKMKLYAMDVVVGLIVLLLVDAFSQFVYFDYIFCTVAMSVFFLLVGAARGGKPAGSMVLRIAFMNLGTLFSFLFIPLPALLYVPIAGAAIICSAFGFALRSGWESGRRMGVISSVTGLLVLISLLSFVFYPQLISAVNTRTWNKPASEFEFVSFQGDTVKSADLKGRVIILDFWNSGCGTCIASSPDLEKLYRKYKDNPDVKLFCVDGGWKSLEHEREFVRKKGYALPFVYDQDSRQEKLLGFGGAGFLIIIDRKYTIRFQHLGYNRAEDFVGSISGHIEQLLSMPK